MLGGSNESEDFNKRLFSDFDKVKIRKGYLEKLRASLDTNDAIKQV